MPDRTRNRTLDVGMLLVALLTGAFVGSVLDLSRGEAASSSAHASARGESIEPYLSDRVHVDRALREQIDSILAGHEAAKRSLRRRVDRTFEPERKALLDSTRRSIRRVMTADQAVRYDSILADFDRRHGGIRSTRVLKAR